MANPPSASEKMKPEPIGIGMTLGGAGGLVLGGMAGGALGASVGGVLGGLLGHFVEHHELRLRESQEEL